MPRGTHHCLQALKNGPQRNGSRRRNARGGKRVLSTDVFDLGAKTTNFLELRHRIQWAFDLNVF